MVDVVDDDDGRGRLWTITGVGEESVREREKRNDKGEREAYVIYVWYDDIV